MPLSTEVKLIPELSPYNPCGKGDHQTRSEYSQCSCSLHPARIIKKESYSSLDRNKLSRLNSISSCFISADDGTEVNDNFECPPQIPK